MPLTPQQRETLRNFVGYGVQDAKYIFIGPEEAGDGSLLNLETRCATFPGPYHNKNLACADLGAAYAAAGNQQEAQRYRDAVLPGETPTWHFAAHLVARLRALESNAQGPTDCFDEYRALGTGDGDTLLAELFHLPKPSMGKWPPAYAAEFGYQNQDAYYDDIWPRSATPGGGSCLRADVLAAALAAIPLGPDRMVFGYGRGGRGAEFWIRFDTLLGPNLSWAEIIPDVAQIARHKSGAVVARLGHPSARSANRIKVGHIPVLVAAIAGLP